jgi:hypothetical protein
LFSFVPMILTFCYKLQRWWNHIVTMLISILGNTQFLMLLYCFFIHIYLSIACL